MADINNSLGQPQNNFNLRVNELGEPLIENVYNIEFEGATVTDEGSNKVKVTVEQQENLNLRVYEEGQPENENIDEIAFVGATVTDDGGGKVTVTVAGGGIANVIQRVFSVTLAQLGAVDFNDDIPAKIKAYAIANSITKAVNETHDWEVVESFNFDFEYTGTAMFDNYGIEDEATFITYLEGQGATNIIVTDFQLTPSRLRCNLTFDGITELDLSNFGINKINNLDSLVNLTTLYLSKNQITTIENLDSLVNLTVLSLNQNEILKIENLDSLVNLTYLYLNSNQITTIENLDSLVNLTILNLNSNQITTAQFNILNTWALLAPSNGIIYTNNNTNNFNTSTTYTTLLGKGWTIFL